MIVYWTAYTESDTISPFKFKEPYPVLKRVNDMAEGLPLPENYKLCPAFRDVHNNCFELSFPCDYNLTVKRENNGTRLETNNYDQEFFDEMMYFRSPGHNLFSYNVRYMFFAEQGLHVSMIHPYFFDSDFATKTMLISGKFNIGKWFRPLDCAFIIKKGVESLSIEEGTPFAYAKFDTDEEIVFKRFYRSDKIKQIQRQLLDIRKHRVRRAITPLQYFYDIFYSLRVKKLILNEINQNLMD